MNTCMVSVVANNKTQGVPYNNARKTVILNSNMILTNENFQNRVVYITNSNF